MSFGYDFELDMESRNSLSLLIGLIKKESVVLEFGTANGRMTKYLFEEMGCKIYGVEIDPDAARDAEKYVQKMITTDIELYGWEKEFEHIAFDYIVFADVLEHLRDPKEVLKRVKRFLKKEGSVLVSIPNIAHNAIALGLLHNEFNYGQTGLLDTTHIRFFTKKTFDELIEETGYFIRYETAIFVEPKNTEFGYDYKDLPKEVGEWMASLPWGEMYQLVYEIKSYKSPIVSELKENNELRMDKYVQLFIENRGGYSEENSIKIEVNKNNSVQKFEFFLGANKGGGIKRLRIDPLNDYAVLKINSIQINEHIYEAPLNTNAFFVEDKIHYFFTADSQIYLDVSQYTSIDKVRCDFEYLCRGKDALDRFLSVFVDMDKKHNEVIIDLKEKLKLETKSKLFETETRDREIEKLSHKIDEIYVSMSWKITKPLRKTFELIRNATR